MFITFEGPEGGGKSTQIALLAEFLRGRGQTVLVTREPGAGDFGREVRRLLLEGEALEPRAELFLFLADRAQHVSAIIRPALARGEVVLCDRHADSTVVYQGAGRGLDREFLVRLNEFATGGLRPHRTYLLDLDPTVGLSRISDKDRLDREPLAFHERIRAGFLAEAARDPERYCTLDAARAPELIQNELRADLLRIAAGTETFPTGSR